MKKAILTLSLVFVAMLGFTSFGQEGTPVAGSEDGPIITVDKEIHDYGKIENGSDGTCVFTVTNTGNAPLIISLCKGSCGCTVPDYPKEPIMPGQKSEVKVRYDTQRIGSFGKTVTLMTTNDEKIVLTIKGNVFKEEDKSVPTQDQAAF